MEQRGQYITLLCEQHQNGFIPEEHLLGVCGSIDSPVFKKFKKHKNGLWFNQRMMDETDKRISYAKSRSKNGRKKWCKTDKPLLNTTIDSMHMHMHMGMHTENGNGNRNIGGIRGECFEEFWKLYPKKTGKGAAEKIWMKISEPAETLDKIKIALEWQKKSDQWGKQDGQFIPLPATYLNQRRWEDERVKTNFERFAEGEIC